MNLVSWNSTLMCFRYILNDTTLSTVIRRALQLLDIPAYPFVANENPMVVNLNAKHLSSLHVHFGIGLSVMQLMTRSQHPYSMDKFI